MARVSLRGECGGKCGRIVEVAGRYCPWCYADFVPTCPVCDGIGKTKRRDGRWVVKETCQRCLGRGVIVDEEGAASIP